MMKKTFDSFPHHSYSREKLSTLGLPDSAIEYMAVHGLPVLDGYWFDNIKFFDESSVKHLDYMGGMVTIGSLYEFHYIAINNNGVYLIDMGLVEDAPSDAECCLVNSSLELFVTFMSIYCFYMDKYDEPLKNDDEAAARLVVSELEREFLALDKIALDNENSLWSVLIEEISYIYI